MCLNVSQNIKTESHLTKGRVAFIIS